ncbi:hypothetical protein A2U01_0116967, partial [Trifolium medium]|nr:hypothetical protein [Trifolium medium]
MSIKTEVATSYLDGFDFVVAQVKVVLPSEHHAYLKEVDVVKVIQDGCLVDQGAPATVQEDLAASD